MTAITTVLAYLGLAVWVPVAVALASSISTVIDFEQLTTRLRNVNQSKMALENLRIWWQSLSMVEKRLPVNKEFLVRITEEHMNAEISAFVKGTQRQGKPKMDADEDENPLLAAKKGGSKKDA